MADSFSPDTLLTECSTDQTYPATIPQGIQVLLDTWRLDLELGTAPPELRIYRSQLFAVAQLRGAYDESSIRTLIQKSASLSRQ